MSRSVRLFVLLTALVAVAAVPVGPSYAGDGPPNRLCDPGFEDEAPGECWTAYGGRYTVTGPVHGGNGSAELCKGSREFCLQSLRQTVRLPRFLDGGSLSVWAYGGTSDTTADCSTTMGAWLVDPLNTSDKFKVETCEESNEEYSHYENSGADLLAWLEEREGRDIQVWAVGRKSDGGQAVVGDMYLDDVYFWVTPSPVEARQVSLELVKHLKAKGHVVNNDSTVSPKCFPEVTVKIQRKVEGAWKKVASTTTDGQGAYQVAIPDKPGKHRAVAPPFETTENTVCGKATSALATHTH